LRNKATLCLTSKWVFSQTVEEHYPCTEILSQRQGMTKLRSENYSFALKNGQFLFIDNQTDKNGIQ